MLEVSLAHTGAIVPWSIGAVSDDDLRVLEEIRGVFALKRERGVLRRTQPLTQSHLLVVASDIVADPRPVFVGARDERDIHHRWESSALISDGGHQGELNIEVPLLFVEIDVGDPEGEDEVAALIHFHLI